MKQIPLTRGMVALVDDEDYEWLSQWKWHAKKDLYTFYAQRSEAGPEPRKVISMHRVILNAPDGIEVDHWDGDGLRNTRNNLRLATDAQNAANRRRRIDNTSGFKGVSWLEQDQRWIASLVVDGKRHLQRSFVNLEEAALAYDQAALAVLGEFARLNFPGREREHGKVSAPRRPAIESGILGCGHPFTSDNVAHYERNGYPRVACRSCRNKARQRNRLRHALQHALQARS